MVTKGSEPEPATRGGAGNAPGTPPARPAWSSRLTSEPVLARGIELLALVPFVTTLLEVLRSPKLQFLDYWWVLARITFADGGLNLPRVRGLQNEHPLILPSLLYWLDARFFEGDNRALGVLVVVVAALTVLLLRAALPRTLPPTVRASAVLGASLLVFSLHGLHNFTRSMSGIAWLGANLLVVAALLLAARGRWQPAWLLALLACGTYGTAFPVWPALALLATLNGEPRWRRFAPLGIGAAVVLTWLAVNEKGIAPGEQPASDLGTLIFRYLTVLGHLWTAESVGIAVIAGVALLACYAVLLTNTVATAAPMRFWWALAAHALMACGMIAMARIDYGAEAGLFSRYTSISVLASLPALVLLLVVLHRRFAKHAHKLAIAAVAAGLLGYALGATTAGVIRDENRLHGLQGVAMRLGLANAYETLNWPLPPAQVLTPRLRALGHYPLTGDFTLGCGGIELGSTLDEQRVRALPAPGEHEPGQLTGEVVRSEVRNGAALFYGWVSEWRDPSRCVLMVDDEGTVTGGGVVRLATGVMPPGGEDIPAGSGFAVLGPEDTSDRIVVLRTSGAMLSLPAKERGTGEN